MRTRQALKNTVASLLLEVVLAVSSFLIPRFFTQVYGSAVNGLVSSISQFITYITLVEAGIGAAGMVALYKPLADQDHHQVSAIVSAARSFYLRSGGIFVAFVALLVLVYPGIVQSEIHNAAFIRTMIAVLAVNGIVDYFFLGKYRVLLQADQKSYIIFIAQIVGTVVMTAVSLVLIELEVSALLVKAVAAAIYVLRSVAVAVYVRRNYPQVSFRAKPNMAAFSQRWSALVHQIVSMVVWNTDAVLLTLLLPENALAEVSVYSLYNLVAYSLQSVINSISNALKSSFGQVLSNGEQEVLNKSYSLFEFMMYILVFVFITCMAVLLFPFVGLYSAEFTDGVVYARWSLVWLFVAAAWVQAVRIPSITLVIAAGHFRETRGRAILEAAINLIVSIVLIGPLGIEGVLLGTIASYLYRTTDCIFYAAKHFVPGTLGLTLRRLLRNGVTMGALLWLGLHTVPMDMSGWLWWFLWAVGCCGVTGCVFVAVNFLFEKSMLGACIQRVRGLLKRGN